MTYEQAKQLKDAGFKKGTAYWEIRDEVNLMPRPTLSEIIKECGADFWALKRIGTEDGSTTRWVACSVDDKHFIDASTPEEAMIKLYVALHSK